MLAGSKAQRMNSTKAQEMAKQQKMEKSGRNLAMPPAIQRQTNKIVELSNAGEDEHIRYSPPDVVPETDGETELKGGVQDVDPNKELMMFVQGSIMAKSTGMSTLNQQLQQTQNEIIERQNLMNEIKSKMLSIQGSIATLQELSAKMKELNLAEADEPQPMMMS